MNILDSCIDKGQSRVNASNIVEGDGLGVTETHVTGSFQVGKVEFKVVSGGRNVKFINIGEGKSDGGEPAVIVNVELFERGGDNACEGVESGIRDNQSVNLANACGKVNLVNFIQSDEIKGSYRGERWEVCFTKRL